MIQSLRRAIAKISGNGYGFSGDFRSFEEALSLCGDGYQGDSAITYARANTRTNGATIFTLDMQVLAALQTVRPRRVLDFGGGLGGRYFHLNRLVRAEDWCVVELPETAHVGQAEYADGTLRFTTEPEQADVVLATGSLQYVSRPYEMIRTLSRCASYLAIDRLPLIDRDRLTIQRVDPALFSGSFPAWFLSENRFRSETRDFLTVMEWGLEHHSVQLDGALISPFRGFLFKTPGA